MVISIGFFFCGILTFYSKASEMIHLPKSFFSGVLFLSSAFALMPNQAISQLEVETNLTLEEYVNDILLGSGIQATNITYTGGTNQLGYMTGAEDVFSINSGLILSCDVAGQKVCRTF